MSTTLQTLGLLAGAHVAAAISPGPNFVLILQAAALSRRQGFAVVAGVWPAGLALAVAGLLGLGAVLASLPFAEIGLRFACGTYLLWIGYRMIAATLIHRQQADAPPVLQGGSNLWLSGFLTNITNPKSITYYMSVFAATGAYDLPTGYKIVAIVMMPTIALAWYCLVVMIVASPYSRSLIDMSADWINRCAGAIMIVFGLKLLAQR